MSIDAVSESQFEATVHDLQTYCEEKSVEAKIRQDTMIAVAITIVGLFLTISAVMLHPTTPFGAFLRGIVGGICSSLIATGIIAIKNYFVRDSYLETKEALNHPEFCQFAHRQGLLAKNTILAAHELFKKYENLRLDALKVDLLRLS